MKNKKRLTAYSHETEKTAVPLTFANRSRTLCIEKAERLTMHPVTRGDGRSWERITVVHRADSGGIPMRVFAMRSHRPRTLCKAFPAGCLRQSLSFYNYIFFIIPYVFLFVNNFYDFYLNWYMIFDPIGIVVLNYCPRIAFSVFIWYTVAKSETCGRSYEK